MGAGKTPALVPGANGNCLRRFYSGEAAAGRQPSCAPVAEHTTVMRMQAPWGYLSCSVTAESLPNVPRAALPASPHELALIEAVGCGVWLYDGESVIYANGAMAELSGYTVAELVSPGFFESCIAPEFRDLINERGRARIRGENPPGRYEVAMTRRDGSLLWLELNARLIEVDGRLLSLVTGLDVTARKRAEEAVAFLSHVSEQLNASFDEEATLVETATAAVPFLGDLAVIDLLTDDGSLRRAAFVHREPGAIQQIHGAVSPAAFGPGHPVHTVLKTGETAVIRGAFPPGSDVPDEQLRILAALGITGAAVVPIAGPSGILGTLSLGWTGTRAPLDPLLVQTAEELGRRAGRALEHGRHFREARAAAETAERSLVMLDALLANSPAGIAFLAPDFTVLRANDAVAGILGVKAGDTLGGRAPDLIPEAWHRLEGVFEQVLMTGEPVVGVEMTSVVRTPHGRRHRNWLSSHYPVHRADGTLLGIGSVVIEITARKEWEILQQRTVDRLQLAQTAARMGTWEWDFIAGVIHWSEEMERLCGLPAGALGGAGVETFLASVHPADREAVRDAFAHIARRGDYEIEHRVVRPDGTFRWLSGRGRIFYDERGRPERAVGVGIDITERKSVEEALQRANAAKDELLGFVSHELRTPLTGILGNVAILRRHNDTLSPEARLSALADVEREGERLQRLIDNMLVLSRVETGHAPDTEPVLVQKLLPRFAAFHRQRNPHRTIELSLADGVAPALAVPTYLEQTVQNLLQNAEKYSPPDQPIEIFAAMDGPFVRVTVADRGPGIDEEERPLVFEAFYRSHTSKARVPGAGLGLSVCKRIVEAQGGRIWVAPREGGGLEVSFTIPEA